MVNRKKIEEFDDAFPDGVFAFPPSPNEQKVRTRALAEYCKQNGKLPKDLSEEEMRQFIVND
ncbi:MULTISPECIES: hypothetical protein [Bacillaceae]|uniref:Uncharacterized protein n=1 Tax=Evansella alkalicola TaxID=745819 RepID=A0ABS6JS06_9BACI|nr:MULTISPECIES: hypothetical protein [Bacillaceae]MBU9721339.1 hypothetical protein [Bacillus alkalicola]